MSAARRRFVTPRKSHCFSASLFLSLLGAAQAAAPDCGPGDTSPRCEENLTVEAQTRGRSIYSSLDAVTASASRLGLNGKETPRSVDVITGQAIRQRGDRTLAAVAERATGMSGVASPTLTNNFSLRGFRPVSWLYNGVEMPGSTLQLGDPAHYERVEVLRGPGSALHGLSAAGGSVNLVSRRPGFARQPIELDYGLASYNSQRLHLGAGGALLDDVAAYRLDVSGSDGGSNVQYEHDRQKRVSGSLLFRLTDEALLTLSLDRMLNRTTNPYYGTPLVDGRIARGLRDINYNNLTDSRIQSNATAFQAGLDWFVTPEIALHNQFYSYSGFREWRNVERFRTQAASRPGYVNRDSFGALAHDDFLIGNRSSLAFDRPLGGFDNRLIVGTDLSRRRFQYYSNGFPGSEEVTLNAPLREPFSQGTQLRRSPVRHVTQNQYAAFLEDSFSLSDRLTLLGQMRYSHMNMDWHFQGPQEQSQTHTYAFSSWSLGPSYALSEHLRLYANYTTGQEPGNDLFFLSPAQTGLPLTRARQWEAGVKGQFWGDQGEAALALYQLRKDNLFVPNAQQPDTLNAVGRQTSRGVELNLVLRPSERWELAGNAAYTHARYDEYRGGSPLRSYNGNRPAYIPEWTANLTARYKPTQQLGLTSSLRYVGSSYNDDANQRKMPAYTTLDLAADYQLTASVDVGFRIRNATNQLYAYQRTYPDQLLIAPPRTYESFVSVRF
ncbi:TonB-dependent receptor [Serratia entomophila]|uniref:TonB-dependent receptor n=1 Tax=Serratia entomophila TaxID=42906 RepID=UPI002179F7D9|nr:TonB-dependent receptor [Serratia entomophila]CAI0807145.1 Ferric hydroxamate uptake [Serratia entomophila]CAI1554350.1 Ferric hydroxamate uptake [Serratia entomophila]CAI1563139.1 Ferric hydroxamate uptake [Serratia entomophila]CAI1621730.1 Ferric hydroxamate uptake [Serratia entomophila]CAI1677213.1 Ferric hydroxamate uptake [Serratia entomophila]